MSTPATEISDWLAKLGISEYAERFSENKIDVSVLRHLTDQDLKDIGVPLGHRRKMLAAISEADTMAPEVFQIESNGSAGALIVSEVRFLRESLAEILTRVAGIPVCGESATLAQALAIARARRPEIVLLDVAFPGGVDAATRLSSALPEANVVALGVVETEDNVFAWAKAGIAGYVPNTASVDDLVSLIRQIRRGEQRCPSPIVGSLLRRIGESKHAAKPSLPWPTPLTRREFEISRLVAAGLSNKEIARRLGIGLGTTKSHVHSLLNKLSLHRRAEVVARMNGPPPSTFP